jgi:hypothetical protein
MIVIFDDYPPYWQLGEEDRLTVYHRSGEIVEAMLDEMAAGGA